MFVWFQQYSLIVLLVLATCVSFAWLVVAHKRLDYPVWALAVLAVAHTLLGVLAVKAFAIIEGFGDLSVVGNMSLFGGMAFMPIFYLLLARLSHRRVFDVFDVFTVSLVSTLFFARINCLIAGCCLGSFIPGTDVRWPTRQTELVFYVVLLVVMVPRVLKGRNVGEMFPLYMASYGAFRFVIELFRASSKALGPFHIAHVWALIALLLGLSILFELRKQKAVTAAAQPQQPHASSKRRQHRRH